MRMHRGSIFALSLAVILLGGRVTAQPITSQRVGSGFNQPLFATAAPGAPDTLYVVERGGTIRTLNTTTGAVGGTAFLNLNNVPNTNLITGGDEQGLLGLAFHPNFQSNGFFYINYTYNDGDPAGATRIERYTYNFTTGTVNPASRQTVLEFNQPFTNHNGGWLGFRPTDGLLYINTGDGGSANDPQNNGQRLDTFLAKVLRIDVNGTTGSLNYAIPPSNPFVNTPGARPEIYSYGLRNPFRASFDRANGNFYIGDVGQDNREEVNFIAANSPGGQNFGWRLREGRIATPTGGVGGPAPPGAVDPILDYDRTQGATVIGGYVYRGGQLLDNGLPLDGTYFFADFISDRVWSFRYDGTNLTDFRERTAELRNSLNGFTIDSPASFAEDGFGNLYIIDYGGEVFRITGTPIPEPSTLALVGLAVPVWLRLRRRRPAGGVQTVEG